MALVADGSSAGALISADSVNAFDDGGRSTFSNAARPRVPWRLVDRVSLEKWSSGEIRSKTEADRVFDKLKDAVRDGTFDKRRIDPPRTVSPLTFRQFAETLQGASRFREEARDRQDDRLR